MRKRELLVDVDYVVQGDIDTPHRLVRLKDPDQPQRVVTRVGDRYVSIHPTRIKARWDDPTQVAAREREDRRTARHRKAIDLAERLGFTVARDGDGWEAHHNAEARLGMRRGWMYRPGRDPLEMDVEVDLDAWLRVAPILADALAFYRHEEQAARDRAAARAIAREQAQAELTRHHLAAREGSP